jgi:DNA-binding transcriptional MerR regulator
MAQEYTVGRVAELAGVTVRTLHHYDEIGLIVPSGRTPAGYRVYEPADIERLTRALTYRSLGFSLDQIAELLDDPAADQVGHLRRQRQLLLERGEQLSAMVAAIDKELEAKAMGMQLTPEEQLEVFGTDKVGGEWADEAEQRWGETDAFRESQRRTASYTKEDWERLKVESDEGLRAFADAMQRGVRADGPEARTLAEQHREFLCRWFYDCGYEKHRGLADTYVADERFTATFDIVATGLAAYVRDAIVANAEAHEG